LYKKYTPNVQIVKSCTEIVDFLASANREKSLQRPVELALDDIGRQGGADPRSLDEVATPLSQKSHLLASSLSASKMGTPA
jgi:hypothetical protein